MKKLLCVALVACTLFGAAAQTTGKLQRDAKYFADPSCSKLAPGVDSKQIAKIEHNTLRVAAEKMLAGLYDTAYRVASYSAYASPAALAQTIRLGDGFSRYENPTGMYLSAGENIVLVGPSKGKKLVLMAPELTRRPAEGVEPTKDPKGWGLLGQQFSLQEGVNIVRLDKSANVYVAYYDDQPETAPAITIHFLTGEVNGVFRPEMGNAEWDSLLANAVSPMMDAVGSYIQVAYPVEWLKHYASGKGVELLAAYDTMLFKQYQLMGLVKYNKVPKNHLFARVNYNYYMFRDRDGVAYLGNKSTMGMVADPARVVKGDPCWGFSHEVGHVLQMRPQMTWGGMTEVSNNIFSMNNLAQLDPFQPSRLKRQDNYNKARAAIIDKGISYLEDGDPFNRLVPFWQLQLYFAGQKGYKDFYPDVMEALRNRPVAGEGRKESIKNQFDFIKVVCDVTKTDLTDFFDKWGFFKVGTIELDDYGRYTHVVTPEMVDETKAYIASKGYAKPNVDVTTVTD